MYTPKSFRELDQLIAVDLIHSYGFATLFSGSAHDPMISHVPMILDQPASGGARLLGHVARANRHWKHFDGTEQALAIFHGPHAYVSPSWYANHPSVPTWNYAVVHVHGTPSVLGSEETWGILRLLIEKYEVHQNNPWKAELPPALVEEDLKAIVGFQMPVDRLEAKLKSAKTKMKQIDPVSSPGWNGRTMLAAECWPLSPVSTSNERAAASCGPNARPRPHDE